MESPPPASFQRRLIETTLDDLPPQLRDELAAFGEQTPEIERVYVCWVESVTEGLEPVRGLDVAVKLRQSVDTPEDAYDAARTVLTRFSRASPRLAEQMSIRVLADRAVPAWDAKALLIFRGLC